MVGSEKKNSNQNFSRRLNNVVELLTTQDDLRLQLSFFA